MTDAHVLNLGLVPYEEAWELQRSIAAAVAEGERPDTILLLEHPPTVTTGRRTEESELHIPAGAEVDVVATDRGGKSTFHGPGQLVCYPIFDLKRHGQDVKRYCRDLEEALILTLAKLGVEAQRIDGLTGVWLTPPPRKIASIGIHIAKWVTTHGYALNVDLDPAPFTQWITACGLEDAAFTTSRRELGRPVTVDEAARARARRARGGLRARARGAARARPARRAVTRRHPADPAPELEPAPDEGCTGVEGKVLVREADFFVAMLRFAEQATIHEHPGETRHDRRLHRRLRLHLRRRGSRDRSPRGAAAPLAEGHPAPPLDRGLDDDDADGRGWAAA